MCFWCVKCFVFIEGHEKVSIKKNKKSKIVFCYFLIFMCTVGTWDNLNTGTKFGVENHARHYRFMYLIKSKAAWSRRRISTKQQALFIIGQKSEKKKMLGSHPDFTSLWNILLTFLSGNMQLMGRRHSTKARLCTPGACWYQPKLQGTK